MGRGKFKGKPTGRRQFSTPEQMMSGTSASRPRTFKKEEAEVEEDERSDEESVEESEDETEKTKGTKGVIQIENPNLAKPKNLKARDADLIWLSVLLREEIERQRAHERYMRLQEQGKTEQARKDLERLALIRQQREEAAKKREEEKAAKEQKKMEARK
ncbi:28 kDa heat- and acid-stable phosphoprotein-like isoform X5 [Sesamum indicum]|uniref:28 kDa heat- and acid-stable phosphoprotein-like isoform X5 n=1 Tax=Sesamum indicum TaxID=4182 RepID=A0A8M8UYQ4_SESIN|nr:28 kDa heat- and acid-stable phosphoprotein-like isoform X5 [Sesamum indicum]